MTRLTNLLLAWLYRNMIFKNHRDFRYFRSIHGCSERYQTILYIQRLLQRSLTQLHWPCRHPLWFHLGLHAEERWPIKSHDQARNHQYDSNRPVRHLSPAPNSSILNMPRLLPLIHARLPVSQQWTSVIHQIYSATLVAVVLMNSLPQNKIYISDI
jgi:hypothetical protein